MGARVLCAVLGTLLGGCVGRAEAPRSLEVSPPRLAATSIDLPRDGLGAERAAVESEPPMLLVVEPRTAAEASACVFNVVQVGLPAVRADGGAVAFVEWDDRAAGAGADFVTEDLRDVERSQRRRLADDALDRGRKPRECEAYQGRLRERVAAFNVELADYRPLEPLDVVVVDAERNDGEIDPSLIVPARVLPDRARPVQAMYRAGSFVLRVPGLRVLSTQPKTGWRVHDEGCDADPHLEQVWGDRSTGVGVVSVNHLGTQAQCSAGASAFHSIDVPPTVFSELATRPSEPYWRQIDAACANRA